MTEEEFNPEVNCTFSVKFDPETKESYSEKISLEKFKELESQDKSYLFKLAAKDSIDKVSKSKEVKVTDEQLQNCSIKYQVLSSNTCFVGVKSQKIKYNVPESKPEVFLGKQSLKTGMHTQCMTVSNQMPPPPQSQ